MATPLLWTRQAGHDRRARARAERVRPTATVTSEERDQIRELLEAARDLWRALPEVEDEGEQRIVSRTTFPARAPGGHPGGDVRCLSSTINGTVLEVDAPVGRTLAETLRDDLGLTGTKIACGEGHCGACTVQLDGVPVLSCITLVHTVGEREVTTIEGLRDHPLVDAFVRADALQCGFCTPGQIVSAAALVEAEPNPDARARSATRWPGTSAAAAPTRRIEEAMLHVARLIRTEKEVEGRYTEQWVVVEGDDDALDQWPQGPGDGRRPAGAAAGRPSARARARRIYTADLALAGMLHAAVLRCPHARARVKQHRPQPRARGSRRARARSAGRVPRARRRAAASTVAPVAAVAADTLRAGPRGARARSTSSGRSSSRCSTPRRPSARSRSVDEPRTLRARRRRARASPRPTWSSRPSTARRPSCTTRWRRTSRSARWEGDTLEVYISTQFIWGDPRRGRAAARPAARQGARRLQLHGRRLRLEERPGRLHVHRAPSSAKRPGRPVRCALTRREENLATGNRNATIQRLRVGARSDGTLDRARGRVRERGRLGRLARRRPTGRWRCSTPATTSARSTYGAKLNLPPNAAFRAPGFVEGTFGLECAARRARRASSSSTRSSCGGATTPTHDLADGRPFSSKKPARVLPARRAALGAARRGARALARARASAASGLASQIWYGGGGPPSYAWVRVGSDGRATVVTAMQDIGTGTRTAMAQIAAEELGLPLDRVERRARRLAREARTPSISAGSSTTPVDGAGRARGRRATPRGRSSRSRRSATTSRSALLAEGRRRSSPPTAARGRSRRSTGLLEDAQILGKGARGPNPTGMRVLTFGVQVAEVAVDVETGEVRGRADRGDPRRRPRDQPARRVGARSRAGSSRASATRSRRSGCVDPTTRHAC